jgi:hypothetical protein
LKTDAIIQDKQFFSVCEISFLSLNFFAIFTLAALVITILHGFLLHATKFCSGVLKMAQLSYKLVHSHETEYKTCRVVLIVLDKVGGTE